MNKHTMEYEKWLKEKAKELRSNPTVSEQNVIKFLRENKIKYHFQVPIMFSKNKGYIADFVLFGNVVFEIDGSTHQTEEAKIKDKQRTEDLESKGYKVVRMRNQSTSSDNIYRVMLDRLKKVMPATAARIQTKKEKQRRSENWKRYNASKPDWNWKEKVWDLSGGHYKSF